MYDGLKHSCLEGDHIVNIFSFSKAYGMMGWRVGYVSNTCISHVHCCIGKKYELIELNCAVVMLKDRGSSS